MRLRATRLAVASGGAEIPLPRRVRNILSKYNASLILPGEQTPVLGPELVVNGIGDNTTGWSGIYGGAVSTVDGNFVVTCTSSQYAGMSRTIPLVAGRVYQFSYRVVDASQSSGVYGFVAQSSDGSLQRSLAFGPHLAPGEYKATFTALHTGGSYVIASAGNGGLVVGETIRLSNISVREILSYNDTHNGFATGNYTDSTGTTPATIDGKVGRVNDAGFGGIHALQATDGYKPVERRGLVNLLTYSNDFLNAAWSAQGGAVKTNSTTLSLPVANSRVTQSGAVGSSSPGRVWTSAWLLSGTGTISLFMYDDGGAYPGNSSQQITLTPTPTLYLHTRTHSDATATRVAMQVTTATGNVTVVSGGAALFQGTVTAQQILEAGGIPVTTSAPASSSLGPRYWQFDAIDDKLQMTFPTGAGWNSATIVQARETGAVTLTGQNIEGTHFITGGGNKYGEIFIPGTASPTAAEIALLQKFANKLSGVQ